MMEYLKEALEVYSQYENYIPSFDEAREILIKEFLDKSDLVKLLNIEDERLIRIMAKKAKKLTEANFGKVIMLFAPLYISNFCQNGCTYCGFSNLKNCPRERLEREQMEIEMKSLKDEGIDSVIILTGEDRVNSDFEYIKSACSVAVDYFSEVSIEVYPLLENEYEELAKIGVVGITIYQETYQKDDYEKLHLFGPKKDYEFRLLTPERALKTGFHEACVGPLLGLSHPEKDAFCAILHAEYLMNKFPKAEISLSFPRFRDANTGFKPSYLVSDKEYIKFLLAARIYLPRVGIVISTRERAALRDALMDICITKMSAGSKTTVGGYATSKDEKLGQFEIDDSRSVSEIVNVIIQKGLRPEFTNWVKGVGKL
ncbi:2-iminoacetate synthase ThiH [Thermoanaerobacter kivui]|uniref:2-iminoacetate synthase ThiH n=1 Tax=Thermoanaerobacter kivui TaxID=2325 RepID=A0A097AQA8_THEKI|nr:2-iminoacetate synthase ThiH [Thermoanaerobacter kivui]AIS52019.1 2-iminoacetate synthase ThiH [Thermoanaerobacter kivui]